MSIEKTTETKQFCIFANGDHNLEFEVEATINGLEIDIGGITIPWDWIEAARKEVFGSTDHHTKGAFGPIDSGDK